MGAQRGMESWASILLCHLAHLGRQSCHLYALAALYTQGNFLVLIIYMQSNKIHRVFYD